MQSARVNLFREDLDGLFANLRTSLCVPREILLRSTWDLPMLMDQESPQRSFGWLSSRFLYAINNQNSVITNEITNENISCRQGVVWKSAGFVRWLFWSTFQASWNAEIWRPREHSPVNHSVHHTENALTTQENAMLKYWNGQQSVLARL